MKKKKTKMRRDHTSEENEMAPKQQTHSTHTAKTFLDNAFAQEVANCTT